MAITAPDIHFLLSGGAANTNPNASLGGAISSTDIVNASLGNLFSTVTGVEARDGSVKYRCFYVKNENTTSTLTGAITFISQLTSSPDTEIDIGVDPAGVNGIATTTPNETTAPAGVAFSRPTTETAALLIGDLAPGAFQAIWVRRTVNAGAAAFNTDTGIVRVQGDTTA